MTTRADHDRDVLDAFGFVLLSRAGGSESYALECRDRAQAEDVRASLKVAGIHVPENQNRTENATVIAYIEREK